MGPPREKVRVARGPIVCDASRVVVRHGPDGTVLNVGRKARIIPPAIHRALAAWGRRDKWAC